MGKSYASIAHQRKMGNFAFGADGLLDWDEVQANYQSNRAQANPEAARREHTARVTSKVVKANFGKVRLAHIEQTYTDRAVSRETLLNEVEDLLTRIRQMPTTGGPALALAFDLSQADAQAILDRITDIALAELGDIRAEAELLVERA